MIESHVKLITCTVMLGFIMVKVNLDSLPFPDIPSRVKNMCYKRCYT